MTQFKQVYDNPYDPNTIDYQGQTLNQASVIKQAIETALMNVSTWLPAVVTKVRGNQQVDIQPLLQRRYTDQTVVALPIIQNVMVSMQMGQNYSIKLPIAVGDTGIALFCQRSLDVWSVQGGLVDPSDTRHHDLCDPVFIPGLYPFNAQTGDNTTDMVLTNGASQIRLLAEGLIKIKNDDYSLNQVLQSLISAIKGLSIDVLGIGPANAQIDIISTLTLSEISNQLSELLE